MKNYAVLADLRAKATFHIEKAFDRGYDQGYHDGKLDGEAENIEKLEKKLDDEKKVEYKRGYADGKKEVASELNFERGYYKGYEDGKTDIVSKAKAEVSQYREGYDKGLKHGQELRAEEVKCAEACGMKRAWNVAKKILSRHGEGYDATDREVFGTDDVFSLSASEAVARLEAWEKKQEQTEKSCDNCKYNNREKTSYPCAVCLRKIDGRHAMWEEKEDYVRDATPEESKSVNDYIKSISEETGVTFNEKEEQTTTLCGKCIHSHNMHGNILTCDAVPCVIEDGHCDKYEEKQEHSDIVPEPPLVDCNECAKFQVDCSGFGSMKSHCTAFKKKQDATEINVGSIAVWDEVVDNFGNKLLVTHIYSESRNADTMDANGRFERFPSEVLKKTGKQYNLQALLDTMKNEKEEVEI